jgi:hypothetical protein
MKKLVDKLFTYLSDFIFLVVLAPFIFIFTMLTFLFLLPISYFQNKINEKAYSEFLKANNGKNFFCYNNKVKAQFFIEENILPNLRKDIHIVFVNGRQVESEFGSEAISKALREFKHYQKFPHLMKIRNGEVIDVSINNHFYNTLTLKNEATELLKEIDIFFDLPK